MSLLLRFTRWRRKRHVQNAATGVVVVLGPVLALTTYLVLGPLDQARALWPPI